MSTKLLLAPSQLEITANGAKGGGGGSMFCVLEVLKNTDLGPGESSGSGYVLHLPKEISDVFSLDWSQEELGGDWISKLITAGTQGGGTGGTGGAVLNSGLAFGMDVLEGMDIAAGAIKEAKRFLGIANNPRNTLLFKNPNLRNLQFSWDLVPLNAQMAQNYQDFITDLRVSMHPEVSGAAWLTPKLFRITIKVQGKTILKTERCAMTNLTFNPMGSDAPSFHSDGFPVHGILTIELQEVYPMSQGLISTLYK